VSDAPTSVADIPATIMKAAGLPNPYRGDPVDEIAPRDQRTRSFGRKFRVTGSVYDLGAWKEVETEPSRLSAEPYRWGSVIRFGFLGDAMPYQTEGWSAPEEAFTWTDGPSASLVLPVTGAGAPLTLRAKVRPLLVRRNISRQRVRLQVNGKEVGEATVGGTGDMTFDIPGGLLTDPQRLELTFGLPDAASPAQFGISTDRRRLGVAFFTLQLTENVPPAQD
jgi:hypothetical protein